MSRIFSRPLGYSVLVAVAAGLAIPAAAQTSAAASSVAPGFTPGARTIVADNFSSTAVGAMPRGWQTNGSGSVATASGFSGKWLEMAPFSTYKLAGADPLPQRFTIEFDVLTDADKTRNADGFDFGFASDNSVAKYIAGAYNNGAIAAVGVNYVGSTSVASSVTDYYRASQIDLSGYAKKVMHVSIAVDGDMARIYLDQQKIADTKLFDGTGPKYFFISAPTRTTQGAKLLFSNFRLAQ